MCYCCCNKFVKLCQKVKIYVLVEEADSDGDIEDYGWLKRRKYQSTMRCQVMALGQNFYPILTSIKKF